MANWAQCERFHLEEKIHNYEKKNNFTLYLLFIIIIIIRAYSTGHELKKKECLKYTAFTVTLILIMRKGNY